MKSDMKKYRKTHIVWGGVTIKTAGKLNKEMPLTTKSRDDQTYVLIRTRESWLSYAIFGSNPRDRGWDWSLLKHLRRHVASRQKDLRSRITEAIEEQPEDETYDPMDAMGPCGREDLQPSARKKTKKAFIPQVVTVQMHEWPPEADVGCSETMREVRLFLEGNQKLWIHWADVEWLVRSLWVNCQLKSVPNVPGEDKGPGADKTIAPSQSDSE